MKVLFIDDNEADRRIVKEAFAACGEDIVLYTAEDGEMALRFLGHEGEFVEMPKPDLILLDLNLPGAHGKEILKEIKSRPETKGIPVIIFTSSAFQQDVCESYRLNASCFINKPMRYTELVSQIKRLCDFWVQDVRYCKN